MAPSNYAPDEAARRRQCTLHQGSVNPFCYPCNEREQQEAAFASMEEHLRIITTACPHGEVSIGLCVLCIADLTEGEQ